MWSDVSLIPRAAKSPSVKLCWHMGILYTPLISHRWTFNFVQCTLCGYCEWLIVYMHQSLCYCVCMRKCVCVSVYEWESVYVLVFSSTHSFICTTQNADTPVLTDGLLSLMPLSKPTASNETDWREARMWLREMAGMGLHRIEFIMGWPWFCRRSRLAKYLIS